MPSLPGGGVALLWLRATFYTTAIMRIGFVPAVLALLVSLSFPALGQNSATAQEKHLRNVQQLTFGGQNAEAYFSADGKKLIYQSSHGDVQCDQIFVMNVDGSDQHMVSTGKGRTTCSYI